jgi:hypothetical protein
LFSYNREGISTIDSNLEYSLRDLRKLKTDMKYDVTFWYCERDVPPPSQTENAPRDCISPLQVLEAIKSQSFKVWHPKSETRAKIKLELR